MRLALLGAAAGIALAGCAHIDTPADEDYEVGDLSGSVLDLQAHYCANAEPRQRALALAALEAADIKVPDSGACTDILDLVGDRDLEALGEIDVEAAEEDQEAAKERLEEQEEGED